MHAQCLLLCGQAIIESLGGLGHIVKVGPSSYCVKHSQHT